MKSAALALFVIAVVCVLPLSASAQEKAAEVSITGCFNKAETAGLFVITDESNGKKVTVSGDATMLARHANNHKVTLTGSMARENDKDVLKATNLRMLAVCE